MIFKTNAKAPSLNALSHNNIRLDCTPETIRAVWKADTRAEMLAALVEHFDGDEGKADDFYHQRRMASFYDHGTPPGLRCTPIRTWRQIVNDLGGFFGVEEFGRDRLGRTVWYCNAGDSYSPTLAFVGRRMFVCCFADLVESKAYRHFSQEQM